MTSPAAAPVRTDRMPAGIPFIIANEFAERFCFYGVNAILVQYMIQFLHFGDAKAQTWQALFKAGAYFFPLLGAIVSDVFLAKFRTIISFSIVYVIGCFMIAFSTGEASMVLGMLLMAFGTGGIKPCVSTNVGDQFTSANAHLIERAFSYFYLAINIGSAFSIYFCPVLLADPEYGPRYAFGMPGVMMAFATLVFWLGRSRFAVVPAAMSRPGLALPSFLLVFFAVLAFTVFVFTASGNNILLATFTLLASLAAVAALFLKTGLRHVLPPELRAWLERSLTGEGLRIVGKLALLYLFVAFFWSLWDQSNGNSWTVQAQSALMDKHLFGFLGGVAGFEKLAAYEMLPSQVQVVNGIFIILLVPVFTFGIYPLIGRFWTVTPLRKIGIGLFVTASSFLIVASIEQRIQSGEMVSMWWQIAAYSVLTAGEVLVSITALEYSYKQAPLYMKSFIMSLFLLSTSVGNAFTAAVNSLMIEPLQATEISTGEQTWVGLANAADFVTGQKIDFAGDNGITVSDGGGKNGPLAGTFLVAEVDAGGSRVRLMDKVSRQSVASSGRYVANASEVSTYALVGPVYFLFFAGLMGSVAVLFVFFAAWFKEQTYVREDG
ncbi:oligopeptide:H+ symporter [Hydrocarboniphaga effusa]|uniref:POT-type proton-dependent oligopeptide transporter n=1 Tax=Hydrocarboniphaga effusa TaxID=243629 RepID=UPI0035AF9E87